MTTKNQVTLPKKIVDALHLEKGAMFDIKINNNKIELTPVEVVERVYTDAEYARMEELFKKEKGQAKKVTKEYITKLKSRKT
jgi:AbrB family looped-hinge helix DNA binding protein